MRNSNNINNDKCIIMKKVEELPNEQDKNEYWEDLVNWQGGGIEEVSNTNLIQFKKDIDVEIQKRLKK